MTRIAVLGPGGVGGFLAAALTRAGEDVTVIAREQTAKAIGAGGIDVRSLELGDFIARPRACPLLQDEVGVLIVATKATAMKPALTRIQAAPRLVVPMLNGLDHMTRLRQRFGPDKVAAGAIRIESDRPAPGRIIQTSRFSASTSQPTTVPCAPDWSGSRRRSRALRSPPRWVPARPRSCGQSSSG
ncbi:MAG: ketopantoate reductase family protein [Solirubrobacteraceae bacterium]